jgi:DNA repair protein RecO (recombination protein O)
MSAAGLARARAASALQAYVLQRHDWSESSLVLDLFTRERGRLVVVAKGAKRPYSQLRPVLLPFQRIAVTLARAPADEAAEVLGLRQAEWAGALAPLRGQALFAGFYLNELLIRLLQRQDAHPGLFDAYADALVALAVSEEVQRQATLRAFELRLLRETGVLPELATVTATQRPVRNDALYRLDAEAGVVGVVSVREPGQAVEALLEGVLLRALEDALTRAAQPGGAPALRDACAAAGPALRLLLRPLLHYHLGSSRLRTREVLQDVRRLLDDAVASKPSHPAAR